MKLLRAQSTRKPVKFDYLKLEPRQMLSGNSPEFNTHIELAKSYLGNNPETQYLLEGSSNVEFVDGRQFEASTTLLLQQTSVGLPVYETYLTVEFDENNQPVAIYGAGEADLETSSIVRPSISNNEAQLIANHPFEGQRFTSTAELAWNTESQLVWQVETTIGRNPIADLPADFSTTVDALTGNIIAQNRPTGITQLIYNPDTSTGIHERIVINDAIGPAGSQDYALTFDSVVALPGCTGTLVAADVVLSARHCGSSAGDSVRFGEDSSNPVFTATVASVDLPAGNGTLLDGGDFNILTLTADVPETIATPMRLIDLTDELLGLTAATVGYGLNGVGSTGHEFSSDGLRWAGENIIDSYGVPSNQSGSNIISTDFDDGTAGANTIPSGDATPLTLEATTAPGDSGGPILVQFGDEWVVAGVLSGGTTSTSVYGDISWWTGVQPFRAEIEAAGGVFAEGEVQLDQENYAIGETVTLSVSGFSSSTPTVDVSIESSAGDMETVTLSAAGAVYTGSIMLASGAANSGDGTLQANYGGSISTTYGSSSDTATIRRQVLVGTNENDVIEVDLGEVVRVTINGEDFFFNRDLDNSVQIDARLGRDQITINDSDTDETTTLGQYFVDLQGDFGVRADSVELITVNSGGGFDTARMYGTDRDDIFHSTESTNTFTGQQIENIVNGYDRVLAFASPGGFDRASFADTPGDDLFYGSPLFSNMTTPTTFVNARGFSKIAVRATQGGFDVANLLGSDGDDELYASPDLANIRGDGFEINASQFERTTSDGAGGNDKANLIGTTGDDVFLSTSNFGYLHGEGYFNRATRFESMTAHGGEGYDQAVLHDSPGPDFLRATPTYATLMGARFRNQANGFDKVSAFATAGYDIAVLSDSAGDERFVGRPSDAFLVGTDFLNYTRGFNSVRASSSGGNDIAILYDSREDDRFFGSKAYSHLRGATYHNRAENFNRVTAYFDRAVDRGRFVDSTGDDEFIANQDTATLSGDDYFIRAIGLDVATAVSENGGTDLLEKIDVAFTLIDQGDWNEI